MLSDDALNEFEAMWRADFPDRPLDRQQLLDIASRVLRAVEMTYYPIPKPPDS